MIADNTSVTNVKDAGPSAAGAVSDIAALTFILATERCALPANDVREVVRAVLPTRLPKAPPIVEGVLDVRGELVPLLDVRRRFGLPPRPISLDDHIIVVTAGGRVVAFAVERALDVVHIPVREIRAAASVVNEAEHVAGIARLPDGLLVIFDLSAFLSGDETLALDRSLAEARAS